MTGMVNVERVRNSLTDGWMLCTVSWSRLVHYSWSFCE